MTIEQVNEIFRTKYPNGEIFQQGTFNGDTSRVGVIYDKTPVNIKVYEYRYTCYVDLLNRLGFNLQYERDRQNIIDKIARLKKEVELGYEETIFFKWEYTEKEIADKKKYIKHLEDILENAIFVKG